MTTSSIDTYYSQPITSSDEQYLETTQSLDQDAFLKLLVTQLQNQDPLNPLEAQELAAQLAQFSSVEELIGVNESLAGIKKILETNQNENIIDYIGKAVTMAGNTLSIKDGEVDSGSYILESAADVYVTINNTQGETVRIINAGWQESGEHSLDWDGTDDKGGNLSDGSYTFEINAFDLNGSTVSADTYNFGEVKGVTYDQDTPYLIVGEKLVGLEQVLEIRNQI